MFYNFHATCIILLVDFAHNAALGGSASTAAGGRSLDRTDHSLLTSVLLLGRLAWLFKIRGSFLEYALQPRAANWHSSSMDASSSGANLRGVALSGGASFNASFAVRVKPSRQSALANEDQFRSAFEIADTNGDGVLSYQEALEVCFFVCLARM